MSKEKNEKEASEVLSDFLKFIRRCEDDYQAARESVGVEDKRLQDLLHEMEFADGENAKRRAATKLQQSRRERRRQKDEVQRLEPIVNFFNELNHRNTLKKMEQLLGKQRKVEEYPQAMEKLAKIEDMDHIPEICCDEYCKYPARCRSQDEMDRICDECKLSGLFALLVDKEN